MSATALKERLRTDLKVAMQARATGEVRLLRALIAALDNAEAVPFAGMHDHSRAQAADGPSEVARLELDAAAVNAVLAAEVAAREAAAADFVRHGRTDEAERLRGETNLIRNYCNAVTRP